MLYRLWRPTRAVTDRIGVKMIIQNVKILTEQGRFEEGNLYTNNDRLCEEAEADKSQVVDGKGCYAIPGLIDIHFHGSVGYDFCDGTTEAIGAMAKYQLSNGVMGISPATMTMSKEVLTKIGEAAVAYQKAPLLEGADLLGIYMEGPFLSMAKKGAQNPAYIHKPDIQMYQDIQKASGGLIKVCAIAPEEENAMEFVETMKDQVRCSIAHTAADYETAHEAFEKGASQVTHLFNGMMPFTHREPGVVGAALDAKDAFVELICDGVHIHPSMIRATFRMFGDDRVILISDTMMAAGMQDGTYALGGQEVTVRGNKAILKDGTIAGSVTNLMKCMKFAVKTAGIPLESAVKCASLNPAKSIGAEKDYGSLTVGKKANVVLLDQDLEIYSLIKDGKQISK